MSKVIVPGMVQVQLTFVGNQLGLEEGPTLDPGQELQVEKQVEAALIKIDASASS